MGGPRPPPARPPAPAHDMDQPNRELDDLVQRALDSLADESGAERAGLEQAGREMQQRLQRALVEPRRASAPPDSVSIGDARSLLGRAGGVAVLDAPAAESIDSSTLLGLASVGYEAIQDGVANGDPALLSHLSESFGAARSQLMSPKADASGAPTTPHDAMMDLLDDQRTARPSLLRVAGVAVVTSMLTVLATNWLAGSSRATRPSAVVVEVRAAIEDLEARQDQDRSILIDLNDRVQMLADRILSEQERPIIGEE